ncbi:MAG: N-acetyl sugar amidotransferase [Candidatus Cloacimonetes bacterium]|nr:N-acetyl sugar amidotransferase [Candidatus Cloacimonadota bacterium]
MYLQCKRCIMDNESDKTIIFDENCYCNYCTEALKQINTTTYFPNDKGQIKLEEMIANLKSEGRNKPYDCVMGISGGLDSSYLAYLGYKWGLRILAVHIDDGYDTKISVRNIKNLCEATNTEIRNIKPDPVQFNALTLAYMKAGVPNIAIPQDNILFATLYDLMEEQKIKYFLSGGNFALEAILQRGNTHNAMDVVNLKDIHRKYGTQDINKLSFITSYKKYINIKIGRSITLRPLNYINYNREQAINELSEFCDFEYYGGKHLENILTAFTQLYWFPKKFKVDKRKSHYSSMIISGQITREAALEKMKEPLYDDMQMNEYIKIIKNKLEISDDEFNQIMLSPGHQHTDYKTDKLDKILRKIIR